MGKKTAAQDDQFIKKGPWTAEEDEVLINFVKRNGPRDWSSIRSMGLLPRTGKSCRLRWVNKLRPNLKKGCKFSAEEERVVLDLQARFGNKWATIASYLPGRTDNDVKNFWSTRQKRLARILKSSAQASISRSKKNTGKALVEDESPALLLAPKSSSGGQVKEEANLQYQPCSCFCYESADIAKAAPPQVSHHQNIDTSIPECPFQCSFTDLIPPAVPPEVGLPLLPEKAALESPICLDLYNFMDVFPSQEVFEIGNASSLFPDDLSFEDLEDCDDQLEDNGDVDKDYKLELSPAKSFNDFPADMLDYLDEFPKSSGK